MGFIYGGFFLTHFKDTAGSLRFWHILAGVFCLVYFGAISPADAQIVKNLKRPGSLSSAHAELDAIKNCGMCHERSGELSNAKCLECHTEVADSPEILRGNHQANRGINCQDCHSDHKGRAFGMGKWDPTTFDHDKTDHKLTGKHAGLACDQCHKPNKVSKIIRYKPRKKPRKCSAGGCHNNKARNNVHGRQFIRQDCKNCHSLKTGWLPSTFSHDTYEYEGYKLVGGHKGVKCAKCHKKNKKDVIIYRPVNTMNCGDSPCHTDFHAGSLSDQTCEKCHQESNWLDLLFNHQEQSTFTITGKHLDADCEQCHKNRKWKPVEKKCISCHRKDDMHLEKLGSHCEECHDDASWDPRKFNHTLTGFKLGGAHAGMTCDDCHAKSDGVGLYGGLGQECIRCHVDPHLNQFGSFCMGCHSDKTWLPDKFRHSDTAFRLEGEHRMLECEACHKNRIYRNTPMDCYACHATDLLEAGPVPAHSFAGIADCIDCHRAYSWTPARTRNEHKQ
ncbi:hypothetical protein MNBD_NITROSPINAE01-823 [hydrothermal vent metagenome]|uniref:Uncharacterized protein n=1 Tax=hydrothermal vent metagenome TaxID=652676 RepID=A0A3B1CAR2_9ZZZZ